MNDCHKCTNTIGNFTCQCNKGYALDTDRKTCKRMYYSNIFLLVIIFGVHYPSLVKILLEKPH